MSGSLLFGADCRSGLKKWSTPIRRLYRRNHCCTTRQTLERGSVFGHARTEYPGLRPYPGLKRLGCSVMPFHGKRPSNSLNSLNSCESAGLPRFRTQLTRAAASKERKPIFTSLCIRSSLPLLKRVFAEAYLPATDGNATHGFFY